MPSLPTKITLSALFGVFPPAVGRSQTTPASVPCPVNATALRSIPLTARLNDQAFVTTADVWRDFMPGKSIYGHGLIAGVTLRSTDGTPISAELRVDSVWVMLADQRWGGAPTEEGSGDPSRRRVVMRGGPSWPIASTVDVVIRITDRNGYGACVRAPRQTIRRTV
jgi:hypothetical protein